MAHRPHVKQGAGVRHCARLQIPRGIVSLVNIIGHNAVVLGDELALVQKCEGDGPALLWGVIERIQQSLVCGVDIVRAGMLKWLRKIDGLGERRNGQDHGDHVGLPRRLAAPLDAPPHF